MLIACLLNVDGIETRRKQSLIKAARDVRLLHKFGPGRHIGDSYLYRDGRRARITNYDLAFERAGHGVLRYGIRTGYGEKRQRGKGYGKFFNCASCLHAEHGCDVEPLRLAGKGK